MTTVRQEPDPPPQDDLADRFRAGDGQLHLHVANLPKVPGYYDNNSAHSGVSLLRAP